MSDVYNFSLLNVNVNVISGWPTGGAARVDGNWTSRRPVRIGGGMAHDGSMSTTPTGGGITLNRWANENIFEYFYKKAAKTPGFEA